MQVHSVYEVLIHIEGMENGNLFSADITSTPDGIYLQEAPTLSITSIASPGSVTCTVQPPWDVGVTIRNVGEAALDVDFDTLKTKLSFFDITNMIDVTDSFTVEYPDHLELSGDSLLAGDSADEFVFGILKTPCFTGTVRINANVSAEDVNSGFELSDDTRTNGGRYIFVQDPGVPEITATVIEPDTVTSEQGAPWTATLTVTNAGEATLTLSPDDTYIYSDYTLAVPAPPQVFNEAGGGGNATLLGGETKHLVFTVTPTPAIPGGIDLAVKAHIGMIEDNRNAFLEYDTDGEPADIDTDAGTDDDGGTPDGGGSTADVSGTVTIADDLNASSYAVGDVHFAFMAQCPSGPTMPTIYFSHVEESLDLSFAGATRVFAISGVPTGHSFLWAFLDSNGNADPESLEPDLNDAVATTCAEMNLESGDLMTDVEITLDFSMIAF